MPLFDMPLEQLEAYTVPSTAPPDFDSFWADTLHATRAFPLDAHFSQVETGLRLIDCYDVSFRGFAGQVIKAWLLMPRERTEKLPCLVEFVGYTGGRSSPLVWTLWPAAGYAQLIMDIRGQGGGGHTGGTPDLYALGGSPTVPGFMTQGILDPEHYYYRRVFADAVRAVEAAASHSAIDPARVAVHGTSQGGGIALAVAGLLPELPLVMPDVPFLCHYRRATEITDAGPYSEITRFCQRHRDQVAKVFHTLSYFDGVNFAPRAKAAALFSVALMDNVCPPSTVYAAFNSYAGPRTMVVYPFNQHEGGEYAQVQSRLHFLARQWSADYRAT